MQTVTPYNNEGNKKKQIEKMFNSIAGKYDLLNHLLSAGIDRYWRRKLVKKVKNYKHDIILDLATGTGDLAIEASKIKPHEIVAVDISENMLKLGKEKVDKLKLNKFISFIKADAEELPFKDNYFDIVMIAFGIRNFDNLNKGLNEIHRVLKPGGLFITLEFSKPVGFPVKQIFSWYSKKILPVIGKKISGDINAYYYLPDSVNVFYDGEDLVKIFQKQKFHDVQFIPLTFRIVSLYIGFKL